MEVGTLPVEDPVLIVAIAVAVFLVVPLVLRRLDVPGEIGIILVGAAIGPHGLGVLQRDATIVLLGTVGINYLMFVAGLEIDVIDVRSNPWPSLRFGVLSFSLPLVAGTAGGVFFLGFDAPVAVLYAATFASHTLLAYPVIDRLDLAEQHAITTAVSGTLVTDTLALLALTVVATTHTGAPGTWFWAGLFLGMGVYVVVVWTVVPALGTWFFRNVDEESYFEFLFAMTILFVSAVGAGVVGLEPIIGSFLAGLVLNRLIPSTGALMDRIQFVGNALFIPFFLLSVGMLVDPAVFLARTDVWAIGLFGAAALLLTKLLAAWIEGAITETPREARLTAFGLTLGQAAATLAIALLAYEMGIFGEHVVNGIVLLIVIMGVLSPTLTDRFGRRLVRTLEEEPATHERDERVLVPIVGDAAQTESLLDVGMLLRGESGETPLYALSVARRSGGNDPPVERAETRLDSVEEYTSEAAVPLQRLTMIAFNRTDAIVRAVAENRITTIVVPWTVDGGVDEFGFGRPVDRLLSRTDVRVVVARVDDPLNAVDRLHLYLPGRLLEHRGSLDGLSMAKHLADRLDVPLRATVIDGDLDRYRRVLDAVEPSHPVDLESVPTARAVSRDPDDDGEATLRVVLSPRPGARGWTSGIETVASRVGSGETGVSMVVYLHETGPAGARKLFRIE
ncbi:MAG: cation:proton antiporter [Halanaeroarchaeum sp.]